MSVLGKPTEESKAGGIAELWGTGADLLAASRRGAMTAAHEYRDLQAWRQASREFVNVWQDIGRISGWLARIEGIVLYQIARFGNGYGNIVEIGSYQGKSTAAIGFGLVHRGKGTVFAVDPHTGDRGQLAELGIESVNTANMFLRNMAERNLLGVVSPIFKPSVEAAQGFHGGGVRFLFIDGWHSEEAVIADLQSWKPFLTRSAVVIFDDWGTSDEVRSGIRQLRNNAELPKHAFAFGKMMGFAPARFAPGGLQLHWVNPR